MNSSLKILFLANSLFVFAFNALGPLYAIFIQNRFKGGVTLVSFSWATYLISTTIFMFLLSKVGDKLNKKNLLLFAYIIRGLCWLQYAFIINIYHLFFIQIFLGFGEALGTPAFETIFAEHLDRGKHVRDYSDWQILNNIFMALGILLGGFLVSVYGFSSLFVFMSFFAFISALIFYLKSSKITGGRGES